MSNKTKLSIFQFSCLITYPILSLFSGINTYNILKISNINAYISIIISYILGIIPIFIYNYKENLSIKDKINYLFGNILGNIINIILYILYIFIGMLLMYNISNFIINF